MTLLPNDFLRTITEYREQLFDDHIWLATTFSLFRNLAAVKFLPCLSKEKKQDLLDFVADYFSKKEELKNFLFVPLKDIPLWQKDLLEEHFLFALGSDEASECEAFIIHASGKFLLTVNIQDHLILHAIDLQREPETTLAYLVQLDSQLHACLTFAFSSEFGFLTTNPLQCGTALKVQCFLHAPALIQTNSIEEYLEKDSEIQITGLLPNSIGFPGNILVLSNAHTLGLTEEQIVSLLRRWVSKLSAAEHALQKQFDNDEIKKQASRSLGLLTHSYRLDLGEALDALSWLQWGIDLQYIVNNSKQINRLLVPWLWLSRRGHLIWHHQKTNLEKQEITRLRAQVFKSLTEELSISES